MSLNFALIAELLADDGACDPEKAAGRDFGFVQLPQLAVEHLIG